MAAEPDTEDSEISSQSTSSSSDEDATSTDDDENDPSICSLCLSHDRATTEIAECDELKSITQFIESSSITVKKVKYACQTCLYKLYTIIDQNRLKAFREEREHRLATVAALIESTGASVPSTPSIPAAANSVLASSACTSQQAQLETDPLPNDTVDDELISYDSVHEDDEELCESNELPVRAVSPLQDKESENVNNGEEGEEVPEQPESPENPAVPEIGEHQIESNLNSTSAASSPAHLDVMYECSESALMTESGGTLDQYKNPPLQCRYCPKVFVRVKPYNKHIRSHHGKSLSIRSGSSSRTAVTNVIYACTDCSATFESSTKLKNHCRIHLKRYYCSYCHKENLSLFDHDFHEAECKGEHMAKEESTENRRMTRSLARSIRSAKSDQPPKSVKSTKSVKTVKSGKTSTSSRLKSNTTGKVNDADGDKDEDNDDDAATSVAYTDYTGMNSYIEKWVAGTCRSEYGNKLVSKLKKPSPEIDLPPLIVSQKEYDIIMLERLILESEHNVYACGAPSCDYATNNLRDMSLHEILIHKYKTYYFCRKCRGVFTSKLYLDYHLYLQNYAEYHCNKCPMRFDYEYQLQYHLVQHQNNEAFPCLYCDNTFMSDQDLRIHCLETGHDPRKRKKIISIDHTMTIVNETEPEPPPPKKTYKCTINIMDLPKLTNKRPMPIIWPKGTKMFLGDIDFEYQPGRNCVRTK